MGRRGKFIECKGTILEALGSGTEFEDLKDEMAQWRDGMEGTNLENSDKFQLVSEAADTLESTEVEEKARQLEEALEEATEGKPFKAGCPEHVEGKKCKRCGWKGQVYPGRSIPELKVFDPPERDDWGTPGEKYYRKRWKIAEKHHGSITTWTVDNPEKAPAELGRVRAEHEAEVARIKKYNELNRLGRRIPDELEVEPCDVITEALNGTEVKWSEFRKYGKRATSLSRSDRLSNASAGMRAAIVFLQEELDEHKEDERVSEVLEKVGELEEAIEECESIEFPGMFG